MKCIKKTRKTLIACLLVAVMLFSSGIMASAETPIPPAEETTYFNSSITAGDVNFDGIISALDARIILRASASLDKLQPWEMLAADLNGDGKLVANEARKVLIVSSDLEKLPEDKGNTTYKFPKNVMSFFGKDILEIYGGKEKLPKFTEKNFEAGYLAKGYKSLYILPKDTSLPLEKENAKVNSVRGTVNYLFDGKKSISLRELYNIFKKELVIYESQDGGDILATLTYNSHVVYFYSDDLKTDSKIEFTHFNIKYTK